MQAYDLVSHAYLTSKRLDWLLDVIQNKINIKHMIREHMKAMGMVANWSALKTIRAAVVRAKEQRSTVPFQHSSTEFMVQSATHPEVDHIVTIRRGVPALCTCLARSTNHVCSHIVRCLMLQGMSETVLVSQLGFKWGSNHGGYAALWTSEPSASQIPPVTDSCQTCAIATEAHEPTHCPRPAGATRAIACPEGIHQLVDLILSDGDPTPGSKDCDGLLQCLRIYRETQLKKKAVQNAPSLLLSNPKAPPGMSLQRLLPSGEKHKRPGAHKTVPASRTTYDCEQARHNPLHRWRSPLHAQEGGTQEATECRS
jgi:hypothetical protein